MKFDDPKIYEKLFDRSLDMLCIAGMDGFFKVVNPAFSRTLGYSKEEILKTPFIDFVHPEDIEKTKEVYGRLIEKGTEVTSFENRYRHRDGSYRVFSWAASVDQSENFIIAAARDVTEKHKAELRIHQIETMLSQETIMAMTDRKGVITYVNDRFCEVSGYSESELIGKTHKIVNSGVHGAKFFKNLWSTISTGRVWTGLIQNRKKNGEHYFVHSIITPILNIEGAIESYLAVRFEVTDHIQTKDNLKKTLDILNETGSIAKVGGWELDVASGELTWTDETFNILEVEKLDGQKPILPEGLQLFVDEHKPIIETAVERAISHKEAYSLVLRAKTAKGNERWVFTNGKPNLDRNGNVVTLSGTIQDIDDKKNAEQKLEEERVKSIHSSRLASLGELAAGVAHEINNPLAMIEGSASLIPKFVNDESKLKSKLDSIHKSCERVSHIVKSLQKFSRAEPGSKMMPLVLADLVEEAKVLTEIRAKQSGVELSFEKQSDAEVMCCEVEIEQVVVNLINNSIFEVKGRGESWVQIKLYEEDGRVVLRVTDSGKGLPEDVREKLFDPFFTTKEPGEGTGLGLAIVKGILDQHHAEISIDEEVENTSFVVKFQKWG